jgi:hypothetical protein
MPKALPKIVRNAEHWRLVLSHLFAMLGRALHQGEALPDSLFECQYGYPQKIVDQADRLARHTPNMRPLLNALGWGWCLEPTEVPPALDWMAANSAPENPQASGKFFGRIIHVNGCRLQSVSLLNRFSAIMSSNLRQKARSRQVWS